MWCVRFLQARSYQPPKIGKGAVPSVRRVIEDLGLNALAGVLAGRGMVYLPDGRGAGPCGTLARRELHRQIDVARNLHWRRSPLAWSVQHLVPPLQRYYETQQKRAPRSRAGIKIGPKSGGGHNKEALW